MNTETGGISSMSSRIPLTAKQVADACVVLFREQGYDFRS